LGGITRFQFSRYKSLLSLSDEAMELADRHQLDESRLRYVISLEPDDHEELVRQIIQLGLTRAQVKELVEKGDVKAKPEQEGVSRQVVQLAKLMRASEMPDAQHLVQALVAQERDTNIARVRIQNMRRLLEEAEAYLE
jgi:ribosomal protein L19E